MRVLVACDKFKDSLTANEACATIAEALRSCLPNVDIDLCPLADGGEGFAEILTTAAGGQLVRRRVTGPKHEPIEAEFGLVAADRIPTAARALLEPQGAPHFLGIIDMAAASGLALLSSAERDVWQTTSVGTGELLLAAAEAGADAIVLGIGGSATHDLGLGALTALGLRAIDCAGHELPDPTPQRWRQLARFSSALRQLPPLFIASDVTNPLLGSRGAAATYAPQKGLQPADVSRLDHETARIAMLLCEHFGQPDTQMDAPGAGAAGGMGFGFSVATGAKIVPGFEFVCRWCDVDQRIAKADLVITAEGRLDESSWHGKATGAVATRAVAAGKRVHIFAGALNSAAPSGAITLHAISSVGAPLAEALRDTRTNLAAAVHRLFGSAETKTL